MKLKCNSCSERTSHVGSLILLWEGLCAVLLHPLPKALSVQKEECPHREQIAFPGYFTMLRSPRRCTWFHVPMNAAGAYPSACSFTRAFVWGDTLCDGQLDGCDGVVSSGPCWVQCVSLVCLKLWGWPQGSLRSRASLDVAGVSVWHSPSVPSPLVVCPSCCWELLWDHVCVHVLFLFVWNHQANLCTGYDHYLNNVEQKKKKNPICSTKRQCKEQALWLNKFTSVQQNHQMESRGA